MQEEEQQTLRNTLIQEEINPYQAVLEMPEVKIHLTAFPNPSSTAEEENSVLRGLLVDRKVIDTETGPSTEELLTALEGNSAKLYALLRDKAGDLKKVIDINTSSDEESSFLFEGNHILANVTEEQLLGKLDQAYTDLAERLKQM